MTYQFIHIDAYAREGSSQKITDKKTGKVTVKTVRSMRDITDEAERKEDACPHVLQPAPPTILFGCTPGQAADLADEWAVQAKDAQGRKYRKDGLCLLAGVISLPRERENEAEAFFSASLDWLKIKYGDRLKSVVMHDDERHPHIHFYAVPRFGEKFEDVHQGVKASRAAKAAGLKKGAQNKAYIDAMRAFQDEFCAEVALPFGLARIGPGRRRLTRAAWQAEQQQAAYFADAKKVARTAFKKGYKEGLAKAEALAKEIIEKARQEANKLGNRVAGVLSGFTEQWHKPTANAMLQVEKAEKRAADERKKRKDTEIRCKKEADRRVADVANSLQKMKSRCEQAEIEVEKLEKEVCYLKSETNKENGEKFKNSARVLF